MDLQKKIWFLFIIILSFPFFMPTYKEKKKLLKELVQKQEEERRKKIQEEGYNFQDTDAFKRAEKTYRYYVHRVTDFSKLLKLQELQCKQIQGKKVYCLNQPKGAYLVKGFSPISQQFQLGYQALNRYIYRPYRTNLDGTNGLYELQSQAQVIMQQNIKVKPEQVKDEDKKIQYYFNQNIRMANLGYQYDWPKRSYPSSKVPVPETILKLTERAVKIFEEISNEKINYKGQAVIVNYYKPKDYMIGHLDNGQIDQKNPIFSYCYGLSCVFLIGGTQKQDTPTPLLLEAGDLMIMSGFSRICYHGVPRIIENSYKVPTQQQLNFDIKIPENSENIKFLNEKEHIINYFRSHRLNLNIRQVYPSAEEPRKVEAQMEQDQKLKNKMQKQKKVEDRSPGKRKVLQKIEKEGDTEACQGPSF